MCQRIAWWASAALSVALDRRWSAPAAFALAAVLTLGVLSVTSQGARPSLLEGAARSSVVAVAENAEPVNNPELAAKEKATRQASRPRRHVRRSQSDASAGGSSNGGARRFGRAFRIDRHLRKIF